MTNETPLAKAKLQQLDAEFKNPINLDKEITVQFNPETLKVTFANQIQQPSGQGDQSGPQSQQFVGAGSTKLAVQLWFDVTGEQPQGQQYKDVREWTKKVGYFITPAPVAGDKTKFIPPAVRFLWGSFQFDGIMESMEESLEFFSYEGRPLRASVSISLTQQKISEFKINTVKDPPGVTGLGGSGRPGAEPLTPAPAGSTVQGLADSAGRDDWQTVAAANGIENPRRLAPGQLINMNVPRAPRART